MKTLVKVKYDGSHFLGIPYENDSDVSVTQIFDRSKSELKGFDDVEKRKELFYNSFARQKYGISLGGGKREEKSFYQKRKENIFEQVYQKEFENFKKCDDLIPLVIEEVKNDYLLNEFFSFEMDSCEDTFLKVDFKNWYENKMNLIKNRKSTFRKKAYNNPWNRFCTFTYSNQVIYESLTKKVWDEDEGLKYISENTKIVEEKFVKVLKKKLQNLHTRNGWNYAGVFERSKNDRLHFHCLIYIPDGKDIGTYREEEYYSIKDRKKLKANINSDFEKILGRNDFKPINISDGTFASSIDYIIKYIAKNNEKIVYSRGLADSQFVILNFEKNCLFQIDKNSPYYLLQDGCIENARKVTKKELETF